MRVAFLSDDPGYVGGAQLTMDEFGAAAPEPLSSLEEAETVVVGNVTSFGPDLIRQIQGKRVWWYHHDLSPHIHPELKGWLDENAGHIFCSPLQQDRYGFDGELVPPAINLQRFRDSRNGHREGAVSVGSWQNPAKGQQSLLEWARAHDGLDVYGDGPYTPSAPPLDYKGPLDPDDVPEVLAAYETFVHLPWAVEPFGRCVVEAWAAGLSLVVNRLVGAVYWIEEAPDALERAGERFWEVVL